MYATANNSVVEDLSRQPRLKLFVATDITPVGANILAAADNFDSPASALRRFGFLPARDKP
jgi:hypothetical protein